MPVSTGGGGADAVDWTPEWALIAEAVEKVASARNSLVSRYLSNLRIQYNQLLIDGSISVNTPNWVQDGSIRSFQQPPPGGDKRYTAQGHNPLRAQTG